MEFRNTEYKTEIDKKAIFILVLYIWVLCLTLYVFKSNIIESYENFTHEVIGPNLVDGYHIYHIKESNEI